MLNRSELELNESTKIEIVLLYLVYISVNRKRHGFTNTMDQFEIPPAAEGYDT